MRADPSDRIMSVAGPEVSPVSVPRIFALGIVLPFAHPIRLFLCSILPAALIVLLGLGPIERVMTLWHDMLSGQPIAVQPGLTLAPPTTMPLPAMAPEIGIDFLTVEGLLFLAMALWLCAWQRAAARGFAEPLLPWLGGSLLRFPGYVLALAVWLLAPAVLLSLPFMALSWFVGRTLLQQGAVPPNQTPQQALQNLHNTFAIFSDLQWWVIGVAMLLIVLIALWLSARLSPLPPCVASQGWRGAFGRTWRLSHGHGFGLAVSLVGYTVLSFLVLMIASIAFGAAMYAHAGPGAIDPGTGMVFAVVINLFLTALLVLWQASLGALVVRDGLTPAEALDPALFD